MSDQISPPPGANLLEWAVKEYLSAQIQAKHILNYNGANLAYNHAMDTANRLGLMAPQRDKITPFPSPSINITSLATPPSPEPLSSPEKETPPEELPSMKKKLLQLALASALGAATPAAAYGVYSYFNQPDPPPVVSPSEGSVGFTVE